MESHTVLSNKVPTQTHSNLTFNNKTATTPRQIRNTFDKWFRSIKICACSSNKIVNRHISELHTTSI